MNSQRPVPWDFVKYCLIGLDCSLSILNSLVHCAPHLFVVTFYEKIRQHLCHIADFLKCDIIDITESHRASFNYRKQCRVARKYGDTLSVQLREWFDNNNGNRRELTITDKTGVALSISNLGCAISRIRPTWESNFATLIEISTWFFHHIDCIFTGEIKLHVHDPI